MRNKNHIFCVFRIILDAYGIIMQNKNLILCFSAYIRHLWNYNENKNHILCFSDYFRNLWNYNENKNHIYCVFRIILDTYGIIMKIKNHIFCVFRIILDTYGIIMKIKIIYIVFFGLY